MRILTRFVSCQLPACSQLLLSPALVTGIPRLTWALCRRNDAGPVIKCLAFLFWMIPAALFFPAVVVGSVFLALYAAVVLPAIATDDENNHILGGFIFMFRFAALLPSPCAASCSLTQTLFALAGVLLSPASCGTRCETSARKATA